MAGGKGGDASAGCKRRPLLIDQVATRSFFFRVTEFIGDQADNWENGWTAKREEKKAARVWEAREESARGNSRRSSIRTRRRGRIRQGRRRRCGRRIVKGGSGGCFIRNSGRIPAAGRPQRDWLDRQGPSVFRVENVWKGGKEAYSYSRQKRGPRKRLFGRDGGAPGAIYFERGAWWCWWLCWSGSDLHTPVRILANLANLRYGRATGVICASCTCTFPTSARLLQRGRQQRCGRYGVPPTPLYAA